MEVINKVLVICVGQTFGYVKKSIGRQFSFKHKMLAVKQAKGLIGYREDRILLWGGNLSILQVLVDVKCSHCFLWTGSYATLGSSDFKMICETDEVTKIFACHLTGSHNSLVLKYI